MYTLEFYDRIRDIERQYNFSHPISPQQALDIFNKLGFETHPYCEVRNPLGDFDNKDVVEIRVNDCIVYEINGFYLEGW